ncbi:MAG: AtpZ/AtpI family protein [Bacillota bacterium]
MAGRFREFRALALVTEIGLGLAILVLGFTYLGFWLDSRTGKSGLFTIIFLPLGIASGVFYAYNMIKRFGD